MQRLVYEDYRVSRWSGGETREILIYPPHADYQARDFDVRLSTATVNTLRSTFTPLPHFQRFLSVLDHEITLTHQEKTGVRRVHLAPFQQDYFSGDVATLSEGRCRDFNLMLSARMHMQGMILPFINGPLMLPAGMQAVLFAVQPLTVVTAAEQSLPLRALDALWLTAGDGPIMVHNETGNITALVCYFGAREA